MKSTREIIKLTNKKAAEMLRRLRNVMKLEAATAEFKFSQEAIAYSVESREDEESAFIDRGQVRHRCKGKPWKADNHS